MWLDDLRQRLQDRDAAHTRRRARVRLGPCAPQTELAGERDDTALVGGGSHQTLLAFCSNDYLGLANHPALIQAWAEGAERHGVGSGASHLISGHTAAHAALEAELARWQAPFIPDAQALYFSTGYMANLALLSALGSAEATLFCDKLNHASLIDGALLAQAKVQRYPHADLDRLAYQLQQCSTPLKLIVTDAVFSMDGSIAPVAALLRLAQAHDAWLVLDDAHGFGLLGPQGQGVLAQAEVRSQRLIYMATLGKAAGVSGAFVAADPVIIDWLVNTARTYIYTTASPPAVAHTLMRSLALIQSEEGDHRRRLVHDRVAQLRAAPAPGQALGWHWAASTMPIQPMMVGDNARALSLSASLEQQGLWVPAIRPPTVPVGTARLRVTLSASHSPADVERLIAALAQGACQAETVR
ncbi:MAG: 8-amino-7-oxononanoate synthase [Pseudomonadota bacterium]